MPTATLIRTSVATSVCMSLHDSCLRVLKGNNLSKGYAPITLITTGTRFFAEGQIRSAKRPLPSAKAGRHSTSRQRLLCREPHLGLSAKDLPRVSRPSAKIFAMTARGHGKVDLCREPQQALGKEFLNFFPKNFAERLSEELSAKNIDNFFQTFFLPRAMAQLSAKASSLPSAMVMRSAKLGFCVFRNSQLCRGHDHSPRQSHSQF